MTPGSQLFLVAYDYGMGGLWGVIRSPSATLIRERYPELVVVSERPAWMSVEEYGELFGSKLLDINDEPRGMLLAVIADRSN